MSVVLEEVVAADEPATWEALGFEVRDGVVWLGGVALRLAGRGAGEGIVGWRPRRLASPPLGGLAAETAREPASEAPRPDHPNGALALDHVVALTDDLE